MGNELWNVKRKNIKVELPVDYLLVCSQTILTMKSISIVIAFLSCTLFALSQTPAGKKPDVERTILEDLDKEYDPAGISPEKQRQIKRDIDKEVPALKRKLEKLEVDSSLIEFMIDTFRVERFSSRCMELNYSDFAMRDVDYTEAHLYDSLMNKYYKKLLNLLKGEDKKALIQAQKAWLAFRDAEVKLIDKVTEYSSGGTMQVLAESSAYLDMVQRRTITIFEHYTRASRIY